MVERQLVRRLNVLVLLVVGVAGYLFYDAIPALVFYLLLVPFLFAVIITVVWGLAKLSLAAESS